MADTDSDLTLEGLARILRDHMDATAAQFAEVGVRFDAVGARLDTVTRQIEALQREIAGVAALVRELGQFVLRQVDERAEYRRELEEHRQQIRQIFARMEQHDARFEGMSRDIRRILDAMERRGGDGGRREG
jgi:chromosome segregation ATPase